MASPFDRGARGDNGASIPVLAAVPQDSRPSGPGYETFYGLRERPFSLDADPRFFYPSRSHARALEDLRSAVERQERLIVVTGDIGSGKTILCRALVAQLDRRALVAAVPDATTSREEFLKGLLADFGGVSAEDLAGRLHAASATELRHLLEDGLGDALRTGAPALVFIDGAQQVSRGIADEVSVLLDGESSLQVVLVGQPELHDALAAHDMRRLDQRASARCTLAPLDRAGVAGYVSHRLQKAGASPDRIEFSAGAIDLVFERSQGVPRLVNRLCDRALSAAHAQRAARVEPSMIEAVEVRPVAAAASLAPLAPPAAEVCDAAALADAVTGADPLDEWIARIDGTGKRPTASALFDLDRSEPSAPVVATPARPKHRHADGVVVRILIPRRGATRRAHRVERRTDRWARRLANVLLMMTILLAGAAVAPSVIDVSTHLWTQVRTAFGVSAPASSSSALHR